MSKMCSSFVQGDAQHTMRGQTSLVEAIRLACKLYKCQPKHMRNSLSLQQVRCRLWSYMRLYHNRLPGDIGLPRRTAQAHAAMFRRQ